MVLGGLLEHAFDMQQSQPSTVTRARFSERSSPSAT
jgi:hypothetical protein